MAFKLLDAPEGYRGNVAAAEPVPLVRPGVRFVDGGHMEPQKKRTKAVA